MAILYQKGNKTPIDRLHVEVLDETEKLLKNIPKEYESGAMTGLSNAIEGNNIFTFSGGTEDNRENLEYHKGLLHRMNKAYTSMTPEEIQKLEGASTSKLKALKAVNTMKGVLDRSEFVKADVDSIKKYNPNITSYFDVDKLKFLLNE